MSATAISNIEPFVTVFADKNSVRINAARPMDLKEIERVIRCAPPAAEKYKLPLLKLARFGDVRSNKGALRSDENVLEVHGIEGDYDSGIVSMSAAAEALSAANVAALLYTSATHTPEFHKWRVLVALSTPLEGTPEQLRQQHRHWTGVLNAVLGGILETESFTLSQSYFFGPITGKPAPEILRLSGVCIDQIEEIPKPVFTAKANGTAGEAHDKVVRDPTPDADLLEAFECGRDRTPAMLKLSSRWAARGMAADDIEANLLALLGENYLNHAGVDLRTRARPAAESAVGKFGESRRPDGHPGAEIPPPHQDNPISLLAFDLEAILKPIPPERNLLVGIPREAMRSLPAHCRATRRHYCST
jgi:hypothetical protein